MRQLFAPFTLVAALGLMVPTFTVYAQQDALVGVDEVRTEQMKQTVPVIGRLVARQTGNVAAKIAGPVEDFKVEIGDKVTTDQVIALLNSATLRADRDLAASEVKAAQSRLGTFQARLILADQELKRLEKLRSSAAFNKSRYEDAVQNSAIAKAEVSQSRADIETAKARLRRAEINLSYTEIKAPYDGVILSRETEIGSYVQTGDPVVTLLSRNSLEIEVEVPSQRLIALKEGMEFSISLSDGTPLQAMIRAILPRENPLTRTRPVRLSADLPNKDTLADNQSITLLVPAGPERDAVTVHKDAVIQSPNGPMVYLNVDGKAQPRPVQLGQQIGERIEVVYGLMAGDLVVTRGNERLFPGMSLQINGNAPAEAAPVTEEQAEKNGEAS
ncbi:efflux RND transporter periplasmic adaptor subunit [Kiloniella laminariae]|uniref:Efflux RND transporter periplasmic adaptor subunit n=1 Tax=Kiloniella laminariae TaxID=454162 RepID=A0ABT4LE12_9PROT|nr:efflux RND transporter periplasmic adaptor subunit [Kiloniella laminariae]MCZ4279335.1 efflux RND transporter periplasmic adaptor subunit [Kiloniella laminariae]